MISQKRRETEVFSLSFMDVICCGFGAILLIFILTTGQRSDFNERDLTELKLRIGRLEVEIDREKNALEQLGEFATLRDVNIDRMRERNAEDERKLTERERELQLLMQQLAALEDTLGRLIDMQEALRTQEEAAAIPIPNVDRRQYLTGFKLEGEYVLFLVRASGSMLDETIDSALSRLQDPDYQKREAPKWQRTLRALEWMLATLEPETRFQIMLFNDETVPILPHRANDWFSTHDRETISEILTRLHEVVPQGPANMERAFTAVRYMTQLPDSVVLFTDGLPTMSDSIPPTGSDVTNEQRIQYFNVARRQIPPRIPVSTILFPFSGDPAAPALYWILAGTTRGSLVSPSKYWPEI